jgi:phosphoribosylformylglycinamidine cyclo-ligase
MNIDWSAWNPLPIFSLIQQIGDVTNEEMREVFNLGIGLIAIVDKNDVDKVLSIASKINEPGIVIGEVN